MKIVHRVPVRELQSDPITPEYQREVDRSTAKLEREHAAAGRRLEAAQRRAERAERMLSQRKVKPRAVALAWETVELRRQELADIVRLMQAAGAGARHRGRRSYRPVPVTHVTTP